MKLQFETVEVEKSSKFQSQNFHIGDERVILEILRGKMYSNPIQTICQEIMSNARDAHREVGKDHVPIIVKLPNKLEPDFYIKDFGPSISPMRMADVFIKYGASTKRGDNIQSGGFGLGCKSPFSYTDSFSVVCVTPEDSLALAGESPLPQRRIKRQYIAHLDKTGLGEMSCVSEEETTEEVGTTVIITPKEGDFNLFRDQVLRAGYFWSTRPKILGDRNWQWPDIKVEYKGKGWEIHKVDVQVSGVGSAPYALIDGIPYPIKPEHLFKTKKPLFTNYRSVALRLHFKVGELPITANREEIDYQERSIVMLEERINAAFSELTQHLSLSISAAPSLNKAIVAWQTAKRHPHFGQLCAHTMWSPPTNNQLAISLNGELPLKGIFCNSYWRVDNEFGFSRSPDKPKSLHIDDTVLIMEDDSPTATVSRQRLANVFESLPQVKRLYLISFYRKTIVETVTADNGTKSEKNKIIAVEEDYEINKKIAEATCHWNYLDKLKLSDYEKKKVVVPKAAAGGPKAPTIRYAEGLKDHVRATDFETLLKDTNIKYYVKAAGNNFTLPNTEQTLTWRTLTESLNQLAYLGKQINCYLASSRHQALIDKSWIPLQTLVTEVVTAEAAKTNGLLYKNRKSRATNHFSEDFVRRFTARMVEITDQTSLPVQYFKNSPTDDGDIHIYACHLAQTFQLQVKHEDADPLEKMYNKMRQQYPLLTNINYHYNNDLSLVIADLISYVNIKNEQIKKGQKTP